MFLLPAFTELFRSTILSLGSSLFSVVFDAPTFDFLSFLPSSICAKTFKSLNIFLDNCL